jgi:hypothetical protein
MASDGTIDRIPAAWLGSAMTGKVSPLPHQGHRVQVEGVPGSPLEGSDSAFAEHHLVVAVGQHVLGRVEPLLDRGTTVPFEQNRPAAPARRSQQREVLHVPGADLQHVRVARDQRHLPPNSSLR